MKFDLDNVLLFVWLSV